MNRKNFIRMLSGIPLIGISFKALAGGKTDCKTQNDAEGPFYKPNAPSRSVIETEGQPLFIEGKVYRAGDCTSPVSGAVIDVWHCDDHGDYDMKGFKGRGQVKSGKSGGYSFTTIFPPPYGSRPRHIHFKIKVEGQPELTTQLYFEGDPNIKNDFARNAEESRVIRLTTQGNLKKGVFDIYV